MVMLRAQRARGKPRHARLHRPSARKRKFDSTCVRRAIGEKGEHGSVGGELGRAGSVAVSGRSISDPPTSVKSNDNLEAGPRWNIQS